MACVENSPINGDSEMEEGEIVDELDDLSDISSEEEFLLRQRLQVLENYNNVLERKEAKRTNVRPGIYRTETQLRDLSEISASDLDDIILSTKPNVCPKESITVYRRVRPPEQKLLKKQNQRKRRDEDLFDDSRNKEYKKKVHRKKKPEIKVISESSESDNDDLKSKRMKLANAVIVHRHKNDRSSLQARLNRMFFGNEFREPLKTNLIDPNPEGKNNKETNLRFPEAAPIIAQISNEFRKDEVEVQETKLLEISETDIPKPKQLVSIDLCTDTEDAISSNNQHEPDILDRDTDSKNSTVESKKVDEDSDEDLELLRQHALKTKASKNNQHKESSEPEIKPLHLSEDEDSDTAELRLICLKSALLKKAIERKQQQKLKKRLSQSLNLEDDLLKDQTDLLDKIKSENNTDIESVDMDIGSDGEEKGKESIDNIAHVSNKKNVYVKSDNKKESQDKVIHKTLKPKEDELEEDVDLLRAKLLTSLSKNLPHLVDPNILCNLDDSVPVIQSTEKNASTILNQVQSKQEPEKRIIINLGESDSEGEHEATKNLTKMHMKLSEQVDFQQKLDLFLKSARMEVEKNKEKLPDIRQPQDNSPQKFVAKAVNHLPKSEQMEYKNLVKRMAELQKTKEARQTTMLNKSQGNDTLKPRNITTDVSKVNNSLDEQIAISRKNIAEESAKILKLKEEATKLAQKYKIVATELRNVATAITFNRREQRSVSIKLSKIRIQHQKLLNSLTSKHFKTNSNVSHSNPNNKVNHPNKLQKENNPATDGENMSMLRTLKVCVVNNVKDNDSTSRLSAQVDAVNNKTVGKLPVPVKERRVDVVDVKTKTEDARSDMSLPSKDHDCSRSLDKSLKENAGGRNDFNDYESPLQALQTPSWESDPNAILCPFEIGGNCKDSDCKYLHTKFPTKQ